MTVVLFSGGMDSTLAAYHTRHQRGDPVHLLTLEYGQRHLLAEIEAARDIAADFKPASHTVASMGPMGGSALTTKAGAIDPASSVVPCRNLFMLLHAAIHAQRVGSTWIVLGCNAEDQEDYADCRRVTLERAAEAATIALGYRLRVSLPFEKLQKWIMLRQANPEAQGAALRSWSCYDPQTRHTHAGLEHEPCGICPACVKRQDAIEAWGQMA